MGSVQVPKIVYLKDAENGLLCTKDCSHGKLAVESHVKEGHRIVLADSGSRDSNCLLVPGNCSADMEVNEMAFAYISQRDLPGEGNPTHPCGP